mmetsp:Transcript_112479/g.305358  ORF Transcript_112479/g.305358 Transcript_112479/m.305358 type:complete len:227 (+) Transcript_112479:299-979(+)
MDMTWPGGPSASRSCPRAPSCSPGSSPAWTRSAARAETQTRRTAAASTSTPAGARSGQATLGRTTTTWRSSRPQTRGQRCPTQRTRRGSPGASCRSARGCRSGSFLGERWCGTTLTATSTPVPRSTPAQAPWSRRAARLSRAAGWARSRSRPIRWLRRTTGAPSTRTPRDNSSTTGRPTGTGASGPSTPPRTAASSRARAPRRVPRRRRRGRRGRARRGRTRTPSP